MLSEATALAEARRLLLSWLDEPKPHLRTHDRDSGADLVVEQGRLRLAVEFKGSSDAAIVGSAIVQARRQAERLQRGAVPVVAVPYMGEVGQRLCAEAGVSWLDLSGNAHIVAPGLRVLIEGKPNKYTRRGRPSTAFAPRSARVARHLLLDPTRSFRQQELAKETGLDDGYVSRIVRRLDADGLIIRHKSGTIRVRDTNLLLDAWAEVYDFTKHTIVRGLVTTRTSEELLTRFAQVFDGSRVRYAMTGLAAAWLHTAFAGFRVVTCFVDQRPSDALLRKLGFREEPTGANVWLVVPNDESVFVAAEKKDGVVAVHPVQAYLDLQAHPERAKEAAEEIRTRLLR